MTQTPEKYALLTVEGKEIKLPLVIGSEGEKGIDISSLRQKTGYVTVDPSFMNTAALPGKFYRASTAWAESLQDPLRGHGPLPERQTAMISLWNPHRKQCWMPCRKQAVSNLLRM